MWTIHFCSPDGILEAYLMMMCIRADFTRQNAWFLSLNALPFLEKPKVYKNPKNTCLFLVLLELPHRKVYLFSLFLCYHCFHVTKLLSFLEMFMLCSHASLDEILRQFYVIAFTFNHLGYNICSFIVLPQKV